MPTSTPGGVIISTFTPEGITNDLLSNPLSVPLTVIGAKPTRTIIAENNATLSPDIDLRGCMANLAFNIIKANLIRNLIRRNLYAAFKVLSPKTYDIFIFEICI